MAAGTYILRKKDNLATNGIVLGRGNSTSRMQTSEADKHFISLYFENTATSGDNRGMYLRLYLSGAGSSGEALRVFTTINNVTAANAHGAHISLSMGTSGKVSGQAIVVRATLQLANQAYTSNQTYAAVQAEIYSDGSTTDPGGAMLLSYFRAVNGGDATGGADVDDDAALFEIVGTTIATGNMVAASATEANYSHSVRCRINGTNYYMMLASTEG